jgi:hypothetical protein
MMSSEDDFPKTETPLSTGVVVIIESPDQEDSNIVDAHEHVPCCRICCTNMFNMNRINGENCYNCCVSCDRNWMKCGDEYDEKCLNYLKLNCGDEYVNNCCGCYNNRRCISPCYYTTRITIIIITAVLIFSGFVYGIAQV